MPPVLETSERKHRVYCFAGLVSWTMEWVSLNNQKVNIPTRCQTGYLALKVFAT